MFGFPNQEKTKQNKISYFVYVNGKQAGPITEAEMRKLIINESVTAETLVWTQGMEQWAQAQFIPSVNKFFLLNKDPQKRTNKDNSPKLQNSRQSDIISALTGLGFKATTVKPVVMDILSSNPTISLEEGIKEALRILQG